VSAVQLPTNPGQAEFALRETQKEISLVRKPEIYAGKRGDFTPGVRFIMVIVAQSGGFLLLFILGTGILPTSLRLDMPHAENIQVGFDFVRWVSWRYVVVSLSILTLGVVTASLTRQFRHWHADLVLLLFVFVDIWFLLMLVYQQGGICRSMFLPVFFLIPTAYLIAERRERAYRWRRVLILALIVSCIYLSYNVAKTFPPGEPGEVRTAVVGEANFFLWPWPIPITDWETLAHTSFDQALFYVSLISAFVPLLQILVVIIQERFKPDSTGTITDIDNPQLDGT
jgi:hypothetical protein